MRDRTVKQAIRSGVRTTPIERKPRRLRIYNNVVLTQDEIKLAVEMARADRIEQQIRDYAYKRGNHAVQR